MSDWSDAQRELQRLANTPAEQLVSTPVETEISDAKADKLLSQAEADRLQQANTLRPIFFWSVVAAMSFTLVASVGIMGFYIWSQWDDLDSAVMIAWMSAAVVETIGLAYIVANYLFPSDPRQSPGSASDAAA